MSDNKIKHRIGWCYNCGFVHDNVRPYTVVENGITIIRPICEKCRKKERENQRMVHCAICGLVKGTMLYATTIERLVFEGQHTCNFIVALCEDCRKNRKHSEILKKLNPIVEKLCASCEDRFKCYTSTHDKPDDSRVFEQDPLHFQRNQKLNRKFWR